MKQKKKGGKTQFTLSSQLKSSATYFTIEGFMKFIKEYPKPKCLKTKKTSYYNVPVSFDIETSSFHSGGQKVAIMYEWTVSYNGEVWYGRYWHEFIELINILANELDLSLEKRLIIYVHNLSYEFQWIRKRFLWDRIFALKEREVLYALTINGIEFRCSYLLSGYSLAKLADNLQTYKIKKLMGDLDYSLIRTPLTPLTPEELNYCINDVQIVVGYISELIVRDGGITNIQLTKTGYVRKFCRDSCYYGFGKKSKSGLQEVQGTNEKINL